MNAEDGTISIVTTSTTVNSDVNKTYNVLISPKLRIYVFVTAANSKTVWMWKKFNASSSDVLFCPLIMIVRRISHFPTYYSCCFYTFNLQRLIFNFKPSSNKIAFFEVLTFVTCTSFNKNLVDRLSPQRAKSTSDFCICMTLPLILCQSFRWAPVTSMCPVLPLLLLVLFSLQCHTSS